MKVDILVNLAIILAGGIGAQWLAWRLRIPSILLLLLGGVLVGPVLRVVHPDQMLGELFFPVISLCVAVILFEGGMSLRLAEFKRVGRVVRNLVSLGVLVTWALAALIGHLLLGLSLSLALLLGAIVVVSGPTVVGPLLRQVRPAKRVGEVLKWEGILIDPVGALLALLVFEVILGASAKDAAVLVVSGVAKTLLIGAFVGLGGAALLLVALWRYWIPNTLHNPVALMFVIAVFTVSQRLQPESGLLAVTLMGIALANQRVVPIRHIIEFKESLRAILLAGLFILLGARLNLAELQFEWLPGLLFLGLLVLLVRPLAVLASTLGTVLLWRERAFLAWVAPRGIVAAAIASVFSIRLAGEGLQHAERLVPLTFIIIIGTVTIYGLTAAPVARLLGVGQSRQQGIVLVGAYAWVCRIARALQEQGVPVLLVDSNYQQLATAQQAGLPTFHASILSDHAEEEIEAAGVGHLLALTANDEVNSLAVQRYAHILGGSRVYQLPPKVVDGTRLETVALHQRGRLLFGKGLTFSTLQTLFTEGGTIKTSKLTADFTYRDLQRAYPHHIPLFVIDRRCAVQVVTADARLKPSSGATVISLIPPEEKEASPEARAGTVDQEDVQVVAAMPSVALPTTAGDVAGQF